MGHFGPSYESKLRFSNILLKSLVWIHISLTLYAHWSYFQRCVEYGPQRPNFWAILGPKVRKISGVWSLPQKVFTGFTTVLLHMLIPSTFRCVENMGLRGLIFGPLWATKYVKIPVFGHFLKNFPLVSHQSWCTCQIGQLLEVS